MSRKQKIHAPLPHSFNEVLTVIAKGKVKPKRGKKSEKKREDSKSKNTS